VRLPCIVEVGIHLASEQERADVAEARERWRHEQPSFDPAHLVFLDETGTSTNMIGTRGRSRRGPPAIKGPQRCPASLPQCQTRPPVLTPSGDGRMVACHNPC
jgi:hypothetical protein